MVDNSSGVPEQIYANSHAYTEDTQTNWNGIIGRMELTIDPHQTKTMDKNAKIHPNFKDFHIEGQHFYANGHKIFLRGKHDACVWPLTGHVAMDVDSWMDYLGTCAAYGLNHVRFHSWCPPEAAFVAGDELGIILQPEAPLLGRLQRERQCADDLPAQGGGEYPAHLRPSSVVPDVRSWQ